MIFSRKTWNKDSLNKKLGSVISTLHEDWEKQIMNGAFRLILEGTPALEYENMDHRAIIREIVRFEADRLFWNAYFLVNGRENFYIDFGERESQFDTRQLIDKYISIFDKKSLRYREYRADEAYKEFFQSSHNVIQLKYELFYEVACEFLKCAEIYFKNLDHYPPVEKPLTKKPLELYKFQIIKKYPDVSYCFHHLALAFNELEKIHPDFVKDCILTD